jgi:SAM-dependent methyltransferase
MKHSNNGRTVAAYENYARRYAAVVSPPTGSGATALRKLAEMLPASPQVLEIGSGPGWDADFLEGLGVRVRRTDVTAAFRSLQAERGRQVDTLDVLDDEITGVYDGVVMLAVLQHFERTELDVVLRKLGNTLRSGGPLLISHPVGDDEVWEHSAAGDYRVVRWSGAALEDRLQHAGFTVAWEKCETEDEGPWRTVLARRAV